MIDATGTWPTAALYIPAKRRRHRREKGRLFLPQGIIPQICKLPVHWDEVIHFSGRKE
jgi:hypothetical protein